MKYILMMHTKGNQPYQIATWPKKDIQAHIAHMIAINKRLREAGELVSAEGLSGPDQAKLVRAGTDGARDLMPSDLPAADVARLEAGEPAAEAHADEPVGCGEHGGRRDRGIARRAALGEGFDLRHQTLAP